MLVRMSIEDDRGQVVPHRREVGAQLVRAVYVGGSLGGELRTVVNNFDISDFTLPELEGAREVGFRARVRIYNGDGQQVLEASRTFKLASLVFPREVRSVVRPENLHISDLGLRQVVGDEASIVFNVAVNAKLGGADSGIGTLYLELIDDGQVVEPSEATALPGKVLPIDLSGVRCSPGFKAGWYQTSFETVVRVEGTGKRSVKAMLFSPAGKMLQSIRQGIDVGVFEAAASGKILDIKEEVAKVGLAEEALGETAPKSEPKAEPAAAANNAAQTAGRSVKADLFSGSVAAVLSYKIGVSGLKPGGYSLTIKFLGSDGVVVGDRESNSGLRVYDGLHEFIESGVLEFVRAVVLTGREDELSGKLRVALNRFRLRAGEQSVQADIRLLGTRGEVVFSELRKFKCRIPGVADGLVSRLVRWISGK